VALGHRPSQRRFTIVVLGIEFGPRHLSLTGVTRRAFRSSPVWWQCPPSCFFHDQKDDDAV
jgi:hypothetical protein